LKPPDVAIVMSMGAIGPLPPLFYEAKDKTMPEPISTTRRLSGLAETDSILMLLTGLRRAGTDALPDPYPSAFQGDDWHAPAMVFIDDTVEGTGDGIAWLVDEVSTSDELAEADSPNVSAQPSASVLTFGMLLSRANWRNRASDTQPSTAERDSEAEYVLREAGRAWGRLLAGKIQQSLRDCHIVNLGTFSVATVQKCLSAMLAHHRLGRVEFDFCRYERGLIEVAAWNSPTTNGSRGDTLEGDSLLVGVLSGLLTVLTRISLDCLQTEVAIGETSPARFVVGLAKRLNQVVEAVREREPHERIMALLEETEV
jgi:hypothetical protein